VNLNTTHLCPKSQLKWTRAVTCLQQFTQQWTFLLKLQLTVHAMKLTQCTPLYVLSVLEWLCIQTLSITYLSGVVQWLKLNTVQTVSHLASLHLRKLKITSRYPRNILRITILYYSIFIFSSWIDLYKKYIQYLRINLFYSASKLEFLKY
jgi:hypothetical protein